MRDHNSLLNILIKKKSAAHVASVRLTSMHLDSRKSLNLFSVGMAFFFLYIPKSETGKWTKIEISMHLLHCDYVKV